MAARIAGGIVAIIAAGLLAWVVVISFGPEAIVAPTVNVTAGNARATTGQGNTLAPPAQTQATADQILAARTRLLQDRTETGPHAFPPLAAGDFAINMAPAGAPNVQDTKQWEADKPGADLLRSRGDIKGISSLPYQEATSFQQPGGRDWRRVHNDPVRYGGGWLIFGTIFALAFFLLARGRIGIEEEWSGEHVLRFGGLERANHWMTATSFVLMGITGLIIIYGKPLLIPLIGEPAFGSVAWWSVWLHMSFAFPFVLGILIMMGLWIFDNFPTWVDWQWLKQGGGFLSDKGPHPPAYKFNAGQKLLFWVLTMGGLGLTASGVILMFPFYWFGYDGMQATQLFHACLALSLVAVVIAHIYIGTIGMEGAFEAMWSGTVDRNWAKEHHRLWYQRITGRSPDTERGDQVAPAE